jgi:alkylated DNA nucleotide flippase Atl1
VRKIPFGETSTYSKIAEAVGMPRAIRAGSQYRWVDYEAKLAAKIKPVR